MKDSITVRLAAAVMIVLSSFPDLRCSLDVGSQPEEKAESGSLKVLFIGSSYFNFNDLPGLFTNLASAADKDVYAGRAIVNGTYLDYHARSPETEDLINEYDWDFVVLQGVCTNMAYLETHNEIFPQSGNHPVKPAIESLMNKIESNCDSTKTVYCMPWAFEDGTTWIEGQNDTFEDMQMKIYENTLAYAEELGFIVAPVGWAWLSVIKEDPGLHYLHLSDWNHPSLRGSYLTMCVIYATLFRESPTGIPYTAGLPEAEANHLRAVASATVLDSLELWSILP